MEPFDKARDESVLISFSTGFYSKGDYGVNPEKSLTVGKQIQMQLDACKKYKFNSVLSQHDVLKDLSKLHEKFVLVPTDKAANNITVVCKKFYLSLIPIST